MVVLRKFSSKLISCCSYKNPSTIVATCTNFCSRKFFVKFAVYRHLPQVYCKFWYIIGPRPYIYMCIIIILIGNLWMFSEMLYTCISNLWKCLPVKVGAIRNRKATVMHIMRWCEQTWLSEVLGAICSWSPVSESIGCCLSVMLSCCQLLHMWDCYRHASYNQTWHTQIFL